MKARPDCRKPNGRRAADLHPFAFPSIARQLCLLSLAALLNCCGCSDGDSHSAQATALQPEGDRWVIRPDDSVQPLLDAAAQSDIKTIEFQEGHYYPTAPAQALFWLNSAHEGLKLRARGQVVLHATPADAAPSEDAPRAVVNHVIYCGDGLTEKTVIEGFQITGADGFVTRKDTDVIQPDTGLPALVRDQFFFSDGGAVKIFGRSSPTLRRLIIHDNHASPCAGGISVEHRGMHQDPVLLEDCVFLRNTATVTGSALDILPGSHAVVTNCLFAGNLSNCGRDEISSGESQFNARNGSGALTVFQGSSVVVTNCTFVGNRNGADDKGRRNRYSKCIFWENNAPGGVSPGPRYALDILSGPEVRDCLFSPEPQPDLRGTFSPSANQVTESDPQFSATKVAQAAPFSGLGFQGWSSLRSLPDPSTTQQLPQE